MTTAATPPKKTRKSQPEKIKLALHDQVQGMCPKCGKFLLSKTRQRTKLFEIAHIYPFSPTPDEVELLKGEERLHEDSDHEDNLIPLCSDCHKIFDNPRTVEGYREMLQLKKELIQEYKLKVERNDNNIDPAIDTIIHAFSNASEDELEAAPLSYEALKLDEKADETLKVSTKRKIQSNITYYYRTVQAKFTEADKLEDGTSDIILSQVKAYYLILKREKLDQTAIFRAMVQWIKSKSPASHDDDIEVVVSFFIQNCEVYS